ncbi:synaptonemal complex protein 3 [Tachyglossus aculeatus]|uniref:synaptonemal complex protein 3 n=1 Tax=Tachyglossus aculeatus TaxID=9261 RepID=UPI0018F62A97|nr:synaptonemal complex protein 3 [Tachyglossus aculeatus]
MATSGENPTVTSDETIIKDEKDEGAFQEEDNKDLSGPQEDVEKGETSVADETETKNPGDVPGEIDEDYRRVEIESLLDGFEGDIGKNLLEVMKGFELYVKASLPESTRGNEQGERTQQNLRDEIKDYYSQEFLKIFQQCNGTVQIFEELYNSVNEPFYQQSVFPPSSLNQILEAFKQKYDKFLKVWGIVVLPLRGCAAQESVTNGKGIEEMETEDEVILMNAQNDLGNILAWLSTLLLDREQQRELATFYKLLKSMFFDGFWKKELVPM